MVFDYATRLKQKRQENDTQTKTQEKKRKERKRTVAIIIEGRKELMKEVPRKNNRAARMCQAECLWVTPGFRPLLKMDE